VHRWKVRRYGYVEVWLVVGSLSINLAVAEEPSLRTPTLRTVKEAKLWASDFAQRHGFEARYQMTGAEKTRHDRKTKPLGVVVPFGTKGKK
jgi:hypothetical protein